MIPNRPLGVIPSPHDHRDYRLNKITSAKKAFPDLFTVPNLISIPYDQGNSGACVAFSLKAIKEMQEELERGKYQAYSAAYIYGARESGDFKGEGMIPREALGALRKRGVCREELMPGIYPYAVCNKMITPEMNKDALKQKIKTYAAVHTVEEVKTALMELGPVTIGFQIYDSFFAGGHLHKPNPDVEKLHGFHMVTLVGWTRDNRWLILNSWGKDWGPLKGYCTIPFDYPIIEMWALTDRVADEKPEYEAYLLKSGPYWMLRFRGKFKSESEARRLLLDPLNNDLNQVGKTILIRKKP
ncbi:MAG: C1 family peptidase [Chitinophagales bacterium]